MRLEAVVAASTDVASTRSRKKKIARLAQLLQQTPDALRRVVVPWLAGELPQGRIGVGYAALSKVRGTPAAPAPSLGVLDVHDALTAIQKISGAGSTKRRHGALVALMAAATAAEQRFIVSLVAGELRQGALLGVMSEGVAEAAAVDGALVRRAAMLSGDLARACVVAFEGGAEALAEFRVEPGRPVQPMLAQTAQDAADAMERIPGARVELKLDGARIQVHRCGGQVTVFSRALRPLTGAVPEVVEAVSSLAGGDLVLDGEVIAMKPDGSPHPFQVTMRRLGRSLDVDALRRTLPLTPVFFDVLVADGVPCVDEPLSFRAARLEALVPEPWRVPHTLPGDAVEAEAFLEWALEHGHEGMMAKAMSSTYEAGNRGVGWLKIKPVWTLDLVVLAAEWGSGRRTGSLSNLHLGARDPGGGFVMLGKTFKGLTDVTLAWQTEALLARETSRDRHVVWVRPELVVEIAFNEIQDSPRYPGGLALRFARVKGYRPDKTAVQADTIDTVRDIHAGRLRKGIHGRSA